MGSLNTSYLSEVEDPSLSQSFSIYVIFPNNVEQRIHLQEGWERRVRSQVFWLGTIRKCLRVSYEIV